MLLASRSAKRASLKSTNIKADAMQMPVACAWDDDESLSLRPKGILLSFGFLATDSTRPALVPTAHVGVLTAILSGLESPDLGVSTKYLRVRVPRDTSGSNQELRARHRIAGTSFSTFPAPPSAYSPLPPSKLLGARAAPLSLIPAPPPFTPPAPPLIRSSLSRRSPLQA
ncbi:hypothetical protein K488DRAFT_88419 [Vararia minispora EC-137]|uniref:Uncharacterized protein n=1 Tax=Vararia minispora EC-137 TaxID=1314806 RepID=A0ACB8QEL9_9AGAM|nr:hypothetical protein K488DRAFT_88419 [Vararia minispora EC-137]